MAPRAALGNAVHPMVAKDKFPDDVKYDTVFLQPARLASRLLQTPQAVHYFLAIITSAPHWRVFKGTPKAATKHPYVEDRHVLGLQRSDFIQVGRALEQVAETLTWVVGDISGSGEMVHKPSVSEISDRCPFTTRCELVISDELYGNLEYAQDSDSKLILQFVLAFAMVHELAHATMYALTEMPHEPIFGPSGADDAGWELEARLCGFCTGFKDGELSKKLSWYELVTSQNQHYIHPPVERVQIDFIQELFTEQIWQHRFPTQGPWTIIPSAAWKTELYLPSSIRALVQAATMFSTPIAEAAKQSDKQKQSDDDYDDQEVIGAEDETAQAE